MTPRQEEQLKRFANDPVMSESVYTLLRNFFLKQRKAEDVYMLAAERLTLFRLEEAWRELESYGETQEEKESSGNIGL